MQETVDDTIGPGPQSFELATRGHQNAEEDKKDEEVPRSDIHSEPMYPQSFKLFFIMSSLCLAVFLVSLVSSYALLLSEGTAAD